MEKNLLKLIKEQAEVDPICRALINESVSNQQRGSGYLWIDTQLDYEEVNEDDFRPY